MASILPFMRKAGAVFDDRVTQIMGEAFDGACKELRDTGQPPIVYEVIAKRIIDAAKNGERDPARLRNAGLAAFGFDNDGKRAPQPGRPFRLQEAVTDPADDEGLRALRSLTALLRAKSWDEPENSGDGP